MSGYQNTFHYVPVQLHIPVPKCSDLTVLLVDVEVNKLLSIGVIKAIPFSKDNFYSRLFLVPKKEGAYRPVIDLSRLNRFVENFHFQMENISCLKTFVRLYDMHRPKGCISLCPRTQVLPKVPVFPVEKPLLCLPRPTRSPQLVDLTQELWEWCLQKSILITAQRLPGKPKIGRASCRERV